MKRTSITIPPDLRVGIEAFLHQHESPPALSAVVQAALREYLNNRGFLVPTEPLRITPAKKGSGRRDVSRRHDEHFAEV